MSNKGKLTVLIVNILMCVGLTLLTYFFMSGWGVLVRAIFYAIAGVGIAASVVAFFWNKIAVLKTAFILLIVAVVTLVAFIVISEVGHLNDYDSDE